MKVIWTKYGTCNSKMNNIFRNSNVKCADAYVKPFYFFLMIHSGTKYSNMLNGIANTSNMIALMILVRLLALQNCFRVKWPSLLGGIGCICYLKRLTETVL